jgi:hypothetical protein
VALPLLRLWSLSSRLSRVRRRVLALWRLRARVRVLRRLRKALRQKAASVRARTAARFFSAWASAARRRAQARAAHKLVLRRAWRQWRSAEGAAAARARVLEGRALVVEFRRRTRTLRGALARWRHVSRPVYVGLST